MKKIFAAVLGMGLTLGTALALNACGEVSANGQKPENWTDQTVVAEAGDVFEITEDMLSVKDEAGNEYRAEYSVTTQTGESVTVISGQFDVKYGEVYIITFTVEIGGKTYSRRYTVSSEDEEAPVITFTQGDKTGITGREYRFPRVTVSDNSGTIASSEQTVYFVNGENREEVDIGSDALSFVPEKSGSYIYALHAADADGNTNEEEYAFYIRDLERQGEIESFNHFSSVGSVTGGAYDSLEWLESYEGHSGVLKFTYGTQEWPYLTVLPRQAIEYYGSAKYVVFRMRFEGGSNPILINCYGDAQSDAKGWKINIDPVEGEWREYRFDARVFLNYFDDFTENRLVWYATQHTPGTIYIDEIYCAWEADIEIETESCRLTEVPEDGLLLKAAADGYDGGYEYTVKELDSAGQEIGENLAQGDRFFPDKTANYMITARPADTSFIGEAKKQIVINAEKFIRLSGEVAPANPMAGDEITVPAGQVSDGVEVLGEEVTLTATYNGKPAEILNGAFVPAISGKLVLTYSAEGCVPVIKEISVLRNSSIAPGEVESFNDPAALSDSIATNGETEWMEEYQGEKGVLKLTFRDTGSADTNWFNLQVVARSENVNDYQGDELVIRMFFASDNEFNNGINCYGDSGAQADGIKVNNPIVRGVWRNYVYNAEVLRKYFGNTAENRMVWWSDHVMNAAAVVYIADISVRTSSSRAANVVEDYVDAASIDRSYASDYEKLEWLSEYQGRSGVLKITYRENDWPYLFVVARHAAENYNNYGDIVFRMWIDDAANPLQVNKYGNDNDIGQDYSVTRGQWVEYTYNADIFRHAPDNPDFNRMVWYSSNKTNEGYIYIDEIYMTRSLPATDEIENFDETESLNRVFTDAKKEWLESYEGEKGVLKLTFSDVTGEIWPYLSILYRHSLKDYRGKTSVVYRMRIEDPNYLVDVNKYGNGSSGDLNIDPVRGEWHDYEFTVTPLLEGGTYWPINRLFWRRKAVEQPVAPVCIYVTSVKVK